MKTFGCFVAANSLTSHQETSQTPNYTTNYTTIHITNLTCHLSIKIKPVPRNMGISEIRYNLCHLPEYVDVYDVIKFLLILTSLSEH